MNKKQLHILILASLVSGINIKAGDNVFPDPILNKDMFPSSIVVFKNDVPEVMKETLKTSKALVYNIGKTLRLITPKENKMMKIILHEGLNHIGTGFMKVIEGTSFTFNLACEHPRIAFCTAVVVTVGFFYAKNRVESYSRTRKIKNKRRKNAVVCERIVEVSEDTKGQLKKQGEKNEDFNKKIDKYNETIEKNVNTIKVFFENKDNIVSETKKTLEKMIRDHFSVSEENYENLTAERKQELLGEYFEECIKKGKKMNEKIDAMIRLISETLIVK